MSEIDVATRAVATDATDALDRAMRNFRIFRWMSFSGQGVKSRGTRAHDWNRVAPREGKLAHATPICPKLFKTDVTRCLVAS